MLTLLLHAFASNDASPAAGAKPILMSLPLHETLIGQRSNGQQFTILRISEQPHAFVIRNFLSAEECEALMKSAKRRGFEVAETTGKTGARRRCDYALLSPSQEAVLASVQSDAARTLLSDEALQTPGGGVEELNVLRYQPGGEYLPHYDARNNPRILYAAPGLELMASHPASLATMVILPSMPCVDRTILYYLNGKGATWFPLADNPQGVGFANDGEAQKHVASLDPTTDGTVVEPAAIGDALAFFNFDEAGDPDPHTLHAGLEVAATEEKWIGTHFFNHPKLCKGYEDYVLV